MSIHVIASLVLAQAQQQSNKSVLPQVQQQNQQSQAHCPL
jgi:hypothetical protein